MKPCPFCAEEIQDDAVKCWHCGEWLIKRISLPRLNSFLQKNRIKLKHSSYVVIRWAILTLSFIIATIMIVLSRALIPYKGFVPGTIRLGLLAWFMVFVWNKTKIIDDMKLEAGSAEIETDTPRNEEHSFLGIISSILALTAIVWFFIMMIMLGTFEPSIYDNQFHKLLNLSAIFYMGLLLVGLGLGFASLLQKNRKKIFCIIGLIINGLPLLIGFFSE